MDIESVVVLLRTARQCEWRAFWDALEVVPPPDEYLKIKAEFNDETEGAVAFLLGIKAE